MGRLSGFKTREVLRRLRTLGCKYLRHGAGSHDLWENPAARRIFPVPCHSGEMKEGTLRAILREAALDVEAFPKE